MRTISVAVNIRGVTYGSYGNDEFKFIRRTTETENREKLGTKFEKKILRLYEDVYSKKKTGKKE